MIRALAPVATLLIGVSILLTGQGLQGTLLPVRASLELFSTWSIGAMGAAYFLGFTLGCLGGGELVRRVGHIRVFLAMTALGSAAPLVHSLVVNPAIWSVLRMTTGFCFAVIYVVIESWLNERSNNQNRGIIFSTYVMISLSVLALGQMMTLVYDPLQWQLFVLASVLISLGALPVALSTSPSPDQPKRVALNLPRLFRLSPSATVGCVTAGLTAGPFWSLSPVFTGAVAGDSSLAAWFMTSTVIGGALTQWPIGLASDRIGRRKMLLIATLVGVGISLAIFFRYEQLNFVMVNLAGAAWGAVAFPLYSLSVAHANDYAEADEYVMVSGGLLLMYGLGAVVGPFLATALMTLTNPAGLYAFTGLSQLFLALFVGYRILHRQRKADDNRTSFGDALTSAHTASRIYEEEVHDHGEQPASN